MQEEIYKEWDAAGIKSINQSYKWQKAEDFLREYNMLSKEQQLFAKDVGILINYIYSQGYSCTFGEAFRTHEQAQIYAREGKGIVDSLHCQRLAIDLNLFKDNNYLDKTEDYQFLGTFWESLSSQNGWGGKFKREDGNHFERRPQ